MKRLSKVFLLMCMECMIGALIVGCGNEAKVASSNSVVATNVAVPENTDDAEVTTTNEAVMATSTPMVEAEVVSTPEAKTGKQTITISAVGDFLIHSQILDSQRFGDDVYNFAPNYEVVRPYLESPDLMIANLETTLSGPDGGYSGYPCFNSPDILADCMKNLGIDVVVNLNNHSLDRRDAGAVRTRQVLADRGFNVIGIREKAEDKRYLVKDVDGVKLGMITYCYSYKDESGNPTLNGIPMGEDLEKCMNIFDPNNLEAAKTDMKQQIEAMKADGVDAIVFYMHWGEEYHLEPMPWQETLAQFLANNGVDIIYGDHPHVVEPYDLVKSTDGTHETHVIYSLDNFIAGQGTICGMDAHTEDGVIFSFDITKDWDTGKTVVENPSYNATWIKVEDRKYQVVSEEDVDKLSSEAIKEQAKASFARTKEIVESRINLR